MEAKTIFKTYQEITSEIDKHINKTTFCLCNCIISFEFNWRKMRTAIQRPIQGIEFSNVEFNKSVDFSAVTDISIFFNAVTFVKEANFRNSRSISPIVFNAVTFQNLSDFSYSYFEHSIVFEKTKFWGRVDFSNTTFKEGVGFKNTMLGKQGKCSLVDFRGSFFEGQFVCSTGTSINADSIKFDNVSFKNGVVFSKTTINGNMSINSLTDVAAFAFHVTHLQGTIEIKNTKFIKIADFINAQLSSLSIEDVDFMEMVDFSHTTFHNTIDMNDVKFHQKVYFYGAKFDSAVSLFNCTFSETVKFVNIEALNNNLLPSFDFQYSTIEKLFMIDVEPDERDYNKTFDRLRWGGDIAFKYCLFKNDSFVIFRSIRNKAGGVNLNYANVLGHITFQDIQAKFISMENATVVGGISLVDSAKFSETNGRHTDCILKNEALKVNDKVNYLTYRKREHIHICKNWFHKDELHKAWWAVKNLCNFCNGITEGFVVGLNWGSNNFGKSWFRGVLFTVSMAIISVAILQTPNSAEFCSNVLTFIWLPNLTGKNMLELQQSSPFFFILGKIAVGFGIYQTIAAFRRYGK